MTPDRYPIEENLFVLRLIDSLCDRFEREWQEARERQWELNDNRLSTSDRQLLFCEYLNIDLEYREREGDFPSQEDYLDRFPDFATAIREMFDKRKANAESAIADPSGRLERPSERMPSEESLTTNAHYQDLRAHAAGGLGAVSVAKDEQLLRDVAIKQLHSRHRENSLTLARFQREARLTARLEHPGIVPIYGMGVDDNGNPFYAMRYVHGETLREAIDRLHSHPERWKSPEWFLELRKLLNRFISVCQTVQYAHSKGIVHRDIKPSNILMGEFGENLVIDWGSAKPVEDDSQADAHPQSSDRNLPVDLTVSGALVGTPAYMSPEQATGEPIASDPALDIYSLGATLADVLTGQSPAPGKDATEVFERVRCGDLNYPRQVIHRIPSALDAICRCALQYEPRKRYSEARLLAEDVELWLAGEPVRVWIEPWWWQTARWVRRHRHASISATIVVLIGAFIGVLAINWSTHEKSHVRLEGVVKAISAADLTSLPSLLRDLENWGNERVPVLERELSGSEPTSDSARNLRLALSTLGENRVEDLVQDLLRCSRTDYLNFRARLLPFSEEISPFLWKEWEKTNTLAETRLRIAGGLALFDPENPSWSNVAEALPTLLCQEPSVWYGLWQSVFDTQSEKLQAGLCRIFDDHSLPEMSRSAAQLLGLLVDNDPELLLDLLQRANREQLPPLIQGIVEQGRSGIPLLQVAVRDQTPVPQASQLNPNQRLPYVIRDRHRARAACALLALGQLDDVWPLLISSSDPTFRYNVIELAPYSGIAPGKIWEWYTNHTHTQLRRTMLLMLGTLPTSAISPQERQAWIAEIQRVERHDPDPGIHAAAQWLLRVWDPESQHQSTEVARFSVNRRWYETANGETFVMIQGPVEFLMGSPQDEYYRDPDDELHLRRINHSWAVASQEVTYQRAVALVPSLATSSLESFSSGHESACKMTWYDAARYCRRLSEEEGVPEEQMCFPPVEKIGPQMQLPEDYFERTGYRIPSQAEWEYACRAGTVTATYFGDDPDLYSAYTSNSTNTNPHVTRIATRKPNDLGLCDPLGNLFEWCYDRCERQPYSQQPGWGRIVSNTPVQKRIAPRRHYSIRGGDANHHPAVIRSAVRTNAPAQQPECVSGFRPVRTLPPDWQAFDIVRMLDIPADEVRYRVCGRGEEFRIETLDPNIIIGPLKGVAPAEISVRSANKKSPQFHFNVIQTSTGNHRSVNGQVINVDWKIDVHPRDSIIKIRG
jgi:serine/threonine protein kinase/formylglycine-generating enzyme required for sulfatase activity